MKKTHEPIEPKVIQEPIFDVYSIWPQDYGGDGLGGFRGDVDELIVRLQMLRDKYPQYDRLTIDIGNHSYSDSPKYSFQVVGIRDETDAEFEIRKLKLTQERERAAEKASKSRASKEARERETLEKLRAKYEKE